MRKLVISLVCAIIALMATAQNQEGGQPQYWENLGKVTLYSNQRKSFSHGEEDVYCDTKVGFLYAAFDGEKMIYKVFVPAYNRSYEASESYSYDGSKVKWDRRGRRITYLPTLSEQYPYVCGAGYFDPTCVYK